MEEVERFSATDLAEYDPIGSVSQGRPHQVTNGDGRHAGLFTARLEAHQKGQGQAGEDTPPEKVFKLVVVVNADGFNLVADQDQQPIPKKGDQYDLEKLASELKKIKDTHADKNDIQVASEDTIKFEVLVRTMDVALSARFPDISLIDSGGAGI